jgi:hypothetical protein
MSSPVKPVLVWLGIAGMRLVPPARTRVCDKSGRAWMPGGISWTLGPSWGRDRTVNHGQLRRPADNHNRSSTAISGVVEPAARIWHARGQAPFQADHA